MSPEQQYETVIARLRAEHILQLDGEDDMLHLRNHQADTEIVFTMKDVSNCVLNILNGTPDKDLNSMDVITETELLLRSYVHSDVTINLPLTESLKVFRRLHGQEVGRAWATAAIAQQEEAKRQAAMPQPPLPKLRRVGFPQRLKYEPRCPQHLP